MEWYRTSLMSYNCTLYGSFTLISPSVCEFETIRKMSRWYEYASVIRTVIVVGRLLNPGSLKSPLKTEQALTWRDYEVTCCSSYLSISWQSLSSASVFRSQTVQEKNQMWLRKEVTFSVLKSGFVLKAEYREQVQRNLYL